MAAQRMSKKGRAFLVREEGFVNHAYNDPSGHCTVGCGHLIHHGACTNADYRRWGRRDPANPVLAKARRAALMLVLRRDLRRFNVAVREVAGRALPQHKFDALVSLAFNIGEGAFRTSTVADRVRRRRGNVGEAMLRWKRSGDDPDMLLPRRQREVNLYRHGRYN